MPLGRGEPADRQGALRAIADEPLGEALVFALAAGFAGYAAWRLWEAAFGDEFGERAAGLGKGLLYAASCALAVTLIVAGDSGAGNEQKETAIVLEWPAGRLIVAAIAAAFLAAGLYNFYRSFTQKFREDLREGELGPEARPWAIAVGVAGHGARGVVFSLIGIFLGRAAWQYDPKEAVGIDGALARLAQQPYGAVLLFAVAAGLIAYALFCFVQARYREV